MTSDRDGAFVWFWLPGAVEPVVAGRLTRSGDTVVFNYGQSFLARDEAVPIYEPELPLRAGLLPLPDGLNMPGSIRDAAPDAWGRRVIVNRLTGRHGNGVDTGMLDELTYLLESGSDRIGALDFQQSANEYVPRLAPAASIDDLVEAASRIEAGQPLPPELDEAMRHGTSIGGARPKALVEENGAKYVAKFSSSGDVFPVVKAEFAAMRLAAACGLDVAATNIVDSAGRDVLLIERFDRPWVNGAWRRRAVVSALTILGLDEMMARYASYQDLCTAVRTRFTDAPKTLRELMGRLTFNILVGNTDDHARNHAAFWDGRSLSLTPAYDICPQNRTGREATQAMAIAGGNAMSRIATCVDAAADFLMDPGDVGRLVAHQIETIRDRWAAVADAASLTRTDRSFLVGRQFLNPFAFENLDETAQPLADLAAGARGAMVNG